MTECEYLLPPAANWFSSGAMSSSPIGVVAYASHNQIVIISECSTSFGHRFVDSNNAKALKGLFTNFKYITFFSCPTERNIFYERFISIKPLWLEIIEKKGCTKSVRVIYMIYITGIGEVQLRCWKNMCVKRLWFTAYVCAVAHRHWQKCNIKWCITGCYTACLHNTPAVGVM